MNREVFIFSTLVVLLGVTLFVGLHFQPELPVLAEPLSKREKPDDIAPPGTRGPSEAAKERKNPFAPPIEIKQPTVVKHPPVVADAPPPPPPPPTNTAPPPPKHIQEWSPAEIPVGFQGIIAMPGQPAEAHLLAKDGSTMVVKVGDEIKSLGLKVLEISASDVTVEVDDHTASLRELLNKNAATTPPAGSGTTAPLSGPTGSTPAPKSQPDVGDFIKKLLGGKSNGGFDMSALKNLTPEQLQQVMSDPQIKKELEQLKKNENTDAPKTNVRSRPAGGGNGNGGGDRPARKNEVNR